MFFLVSAKNTINTKGTGGGGEKRAREEDTKDTERREMRKKALISCNQILLFRFLCQNKPENEDDDDERKIDNFKTKRLGNVSETVAMALITLSLGALKATGSIKPAPSSLLMNPKIDSTNDKIFVSPALIDKVPMSATIQSMKSSLHAFFPPLPARIHPATGAARAKKN